jgi:hypothetical protein
MEQSNVLSLEVSVSQKTIDALLARKTLAVLLPRSMPDDVLVELWRSMSVLNPDPRGKPVPLNAKGFAADWVRVLARRAGVSDELVQARFSEICDETSWLLGNEVAYRVAGGLATRQSRMDHARLVAWLRQLRPRRRRRDNGSAGASPLMGGGTAQP